MSIPAAPASPAHEFGMYKHYRADSLTGDFADAATIKMKTVGMPSG